jgi:hypothetical protein
MCYGVYQSTGKSLTWSLAASRKRYGASFEAIAPRLCRFSSQRQLFAHKQYVRQAMRQHGYSDPSFLDWQSGKLSDNQMFTLLAKLEATLIQNESNELTSLDCNSRYQKHSSFL